MENPLTKKDLSDMKDALYKLSQLDQRLDLLDKIDQDTTEMREKAAFYRKVLSTLRTELFPGQP